MVETSRFRRKMAAMRTEVREALANAIERNADNVCAEMRIMLAVQYPAVAAKVDIGWTWGDAPRGSITVGKVGGRETDQIAVTIYATAKQGSGFSAAWFEFGTAERFTKDGKSTGRITAGPYFFPVYRANKRRVLTSLRSTLRRAVRKINAS
ncbi:hypothetical protein [Sagittula stellata]|uniref:HK97 gp10 family phage protein n=1 Tax=Sagittula stellata (strain ATCC 700073 / DSM 11524 / E-37) TaxID=388399 RepID=A3KA59_SAGS3|nr:hypothetical protein [Sagittula stellata]EBA06002.1 hypothetical protein SSE37_25378 [Sagittula stellata E-37]